MENFCSKEREDEFLCLQQLGVWCQHWVPQALFLSIAVSTGSPLPSSVPLSWELLPTSLTFSGARASLGNQDDVTCIFIYAGAGERAAWFIRTSLWWINFAFEWLCMAHPNEGLQSGLAAPAGQLPGPVWAGRRRESGAVGVNSCRREPSLLPRGTNEPQRKKTKCSSWIALQSPFSHQPRSLSWECTAHTVTREESGVICKIMPYQMFHSHTPFLYFQNCLYVSFQFVWVSISLQN